MAHMISIKPCFCVCFILIFNCYFGARLSVNVCLHDLKAAYFDRNHYIIKRCCTRALHSVVSYCTTKLKIGQLFNMVWFRIGVMDGEQWMGYWWKWEREEKVKVTTPRVRPLYIGILFNENTCDDSGKCLV